MTRLAFISEGRLYLKEGDAEPRLIESPFAAEVVRTGLEIHKKHEWKNRDDNPMMSGRMLWGVSNTDPLATPVRFTAVSRTFRPDELIYFLGTGNVGGCFRYCVTSGVEKRVFHREGFFGGDLECHPETGTFLYSEMKPNGTAHIMAMDHEGGRTKEMTEGDSVDSAPSWVQGSETQIVYQSSGIARSSEGYPMGMGPSSIELYDFETGSVTTLVENEKFDHLQPHRDAEGNLYFIRRPYETSPRPSAGALILDVLLFPYRFIRAIVFLMNFLSVIFAKKPLLTSLGPEAKKPEQAALILRGQVVDARRALARGQKNSAKDVALVPDSWELVKRSAGGEERALARGVVAFDLGADGSIAYSNGTALYVLKEGTRPERILRHKVISEVTAI